MADEKLIEKMLLEGKTEDEIIKILAEEDGIKTNKEVDEIYMQNIIESLESFLQSGKIEKSEADLFTDPDQPIEERNEMALKSLWESAIKYANKGKDIIYNIRTPKGQEIVNLMIKIENKYPQIKKIWRGSEKNSLPGLNAKEQYITHSEDLWIKLGNSIADGNVEEMSKYKNELMKVGEIKTGEAKEISVNPAWSNVVLNIKVEPIGNKHKLSLETDYTT